MVRWRMAEVVERGDVEPMRVQIVERMLDAVDRADEEPARATSPRRVREPETAEMADAVLVRVFMERSTEERVV